jgi:hypothetical protein
MAKKGNTERPTLRRVHFSDVMGTVVTQTHSGETAETADWLIGDEIMGPDLQGEALRSMRAPGTAYHARGRSAVVSGASAAHAHCRLRDSRRGAGQHCPSDDQGGKAAEGCRSNSPRRLHRGGDPAS